MDEQGAEWELAQAEGLKAERERWAAALEASERQITHLTDKAAAIEKSSSPWPAAGGLTLSLQRSGHECTGDGDGKPRGEGCKDGHAPA
jgi:hypothetical protein